MKRMRTAGSQARDVESENQDETIANLRAQLADAKEDTATREAKNKLLGMELKKTKRIESRQIKQ